MNQLGRVRLDQEGAGEPDQHHDDDHCHHWHHLDHIIALIMVLPGAGQDGDEMSYWGRQRTITPKVDDDEDFDWPPDSWALDSWALEPNSP